MSRRSLLGMIGVCAAAPLLAGCGFSPVYQGAPETVLAGQSVAAQLREIFVSLPRDRSEQILRNELLFLLGQPAATGRERARYELQINTVATTKDAIVARSGIISARIVDYRADYALFALDDPQVLHKGRTVQQASFDIGEQQFAAEKARDDAIARAAREAARQLHTQIAAYFASGR